MAPGSSRSGKHVSGARATPSFASSTSSAMASSSSHSIWTLPPRRSVSFGGLRRTPATSQEARVTA
eukprot:scaffold142784_cov232-Phaeocystis_antarctica.AAC.1